MERVFKVRIKNLEVEHKASVHSGNEAFGFYFLGKKVDFNKGKKYVANRPVLRLETLRYRGNDFPKTIFNKIFKAEPNKDLSPDDCLLLQLTKALDKKEISKIQFNVAKVALTQIEEQD